MSYVTESFGWWEEAQNALLNMVLELRTEYRKLFRLRREHPL